VHDENTDWRERRAFVWPLLLGVMIVFASSFSHVAAPDVPNIDKIGHGLVYGLLATLLVRNGFFFKRVWLAVVFVSLFGISDEWHQSFTPGRSVEFADWVADTSGATLAVALYAVWGWYRRLLETSITCSQTRVENSSKIRPTK
jgi:VanZ family protein